MEKTKLMMTKENINTLKLELLLRKMAVRIATNEYKKAVNNFLEIKNKIIDLKKLIKACKTCDSEYVTSVPEVDINCENCDQLGVGDE